MERYRCLQEYEEHRNDDSEDGVATWLDVSLGYDTEFSSSGFGDQIHRQAPPLLG